MKVTVVIIVIMIEDMTENDIIIRIRDYRWWGRWGFRNVLWVWSLGHFANDFQ